MTNGQLIGLLILPLSYAAGVIGLDWHRKVKANKAAGLICDRLGNELTRDQHPRSFALTMLIGRASVALMALMFAAGVSMFIFIMMPV